MLAESISKIQMGDKTNNFMAEAGKIISNMLEARLANNFSASHSNSGSSLSLRSNSSSNLSKSPMVMRKRFDLNDFKDIDPTEPVNLKPVVAVAQQLQHQQQQPNNETGGQKAQPQVSINSVASLRTDLDDNQQHPMGKVLNFCDNKKQSMMDGTPMPVVASVGLPIHIPIPPKPSTVSATLPLPVPSAKPIPSQILNCETNLEHEGILPEGSEAVIYRNNYNLGSRNGVGELSTHAMDRRSYIEPKAQTENSTKNGTIFSVSVKALGGPNVEENTPMTQENEDVVSQLLKDGNRPICCQCNKEITQGPFITALGRIWCPDHFICVNGNCRRPLQDIGFVEEKGDLYCEYCFEKYLAPTCSKCGGKIKGDCLNAIGKQFHSECFTCGHCGKIFGNTPFFLEDGNAYCEADWNELFTTKCFACGFPVEAGDRWVEALNHNYHSQCFNCTYCKQNLEGQSFYNKGGRPFCKNHAR